VGKFEGSRPFGRIKNRLEQNIEVKYKERG